MLLKARVTAEVETRRSNVLRISGACENPEEETPRGAVPRRKRIVRWRPLQGGYSVSGEGKKSKRKLVELFN